MRLRSAPNFPKRRLPSLSAARILNKGKLPLAGGSEKSDLEGTLTKHINVPNDIIINIDGVKKKTLSFNDSFGDDFSGEGDFEETESGEESTESDTTLPSGEDLGVDLTTDTE